MYSKPKKVQLVTLATTAIVCSKILFALFNDLEGANLLIVIGMAAILFLVSLVANLKQSFTGFKKLMLGIFVQVLMIIVFYFCFS